MGGDQRAESAARLRSGTEGRSRVRKWCDGGRRRWRKAAAAAAPARARRRRRPVRVEGEKRRETEREREEGERIFWLIYIQRVFVGAVGDSAAPTNRTAGGGW